MNGRHVAAPQGAAAIQNPAYRPAGDFHEEAFDINGLRGQADIPIPPVMFGLARSRAAWRDPAEPLKAPAGTLQGNRLKQQKEGS